MYMGSSEDLYERTQGVKLVCVHCFATHFQMFTDKFLSQWPVCCGAEMCVAGNPKKDIHKLGRKVIVDPSKNPYAYKGGYHEPAQYPKPMAYRPNFVKSRRLSVSHLRRSKAVSEVLERETYRQKKGNCYVEAE